MIATTARKRATGLMAGVAVYAAGVVALGYPLLPIQSMFEPHIDDPLRTPVLVIAVIIGLCVVSTRVRSGVTALFGGIWCSVDDQFRTGPGRARANALWEQERQLASQQEQANRQAHYEMFQAEENEARYRAEWENRK